MAVESGHLSGFIPQLLLNKQIMMMNAFHNQQSKANANLYSPHLGYGTETPLPMYGSGLADLINLSNNSAPLKPDDSGLTCSLPVSRKRSRDSSSFDPLVSSANGQNMNQTFLGEDISIQIQQQQLEIDQLIARHTEKLRIEMEERRKRNSSRIIAAVEEGISKRLRAKEEEIVKMAKLNWVLEEKVKSLCVENQIWRELAQTHEATANALRSNLNQVLEHAVQDEYRHRSTTACVDDAADDAQSCCESNIEQRRTLAEQDRCNDECTSSSNGSKRWCKNCGKEESCVLLLPCRHLCLCTVCASSVNMCPLCKSTKNISVQVNMS